VRKFDVAAIGEMLIDLVEFGKSAQGNPIFEANPGGAPCNVLAMLSRLGRKTAFIGKVGKDAFGMQLQSALMEAGISDHLAFAKQVRTTLAMVHRLPNGDRDFSFYRNPGADMLLEKDEIDSTVLEDAKIVHFCTISLSREPARSATKHAVSFAKKAGCLVSFDPNIRMPLWDSEEELKEEMEWGLSKCDILKISDNEITFCTGFDDYGKAVAKLREKHGIPLIFVTLGKDGSIAFYKDSVVAAPSFPNAITLDATGAGDAFCGCALHCLLENGLNDLDSFQLLETLKFANAGASLVTQRKGALRAMPGFEEIHKLCKGIDS
jgi:fructokinase